MMDTLSSAERAVAAARQAVKLAPGPNISLATAHLTLARALRATYDLQGAAGMHLLIYLSFTISFAISARDDK